MITLDPKVLGQVQGYTEALKTLNKLGAKIRAVDLHGTSREDSDNNNADIAQYLADGGRDFLACPDDLVKRIGQAFVDEALRGIQVLLDKAEKRKAKGKPANVDALANNVAGKAWKAAGKVWVEEIQRRMDEEDWMATEATN